MPSLRHSSSVDGALVERRIRTYPVSMRSSRRISEPSEIASSSEEERSSHTIDERIHSSLLALYETISRDNWELQGDAIMSVESPKASKINHQVLYPPFYAFMQPISDLDHLAELIGAPSEWHSIYLAALADRDARISAHFHQLIALEDHEYESTIQSKFSDLCHAIARALKADISTNYNTADSIGGILADARYDITSEADLCVSNGNGEYVLTSEIKTNNAFGVRFCWFKRCRGAQVACTLYSKNCPCFLFTPKHWKVFIENQQRDAVLTYPFDDDEHETLFDKSTLMRAMGAGFLQALVICFLAKLTFSDDLPLYDQPSSSPMSSKSRYSASAQPIAKRRRSINQTIIQPKLRSGIDSDGRLVYRQLRVYREDYAVMT